VARQRRDRLDDDAAASDAEDLDATAEDHAADDWRYACNSRPWMKATPKKAEPVHPCSPTMKELMDEHDRRAKLKRACI